MPSALREVLDQESLTSHFQPIVSVKKKRKVGAEALARASHGGLPVPPVLLFQWAQQEGSLLELDRLCRRKAMLGFREIARSDPDLMLFLNFEVGVLDEGVLGSGAIIKLAQELGIKPEHVVIEINESRVADMANLTAFVVHHRANGFLIALDDMGIGYSNLNRLAQLRPDILKLDRSLIMGLDGDYFRQEIFKSLVSLARNIGALVLAEGVETENEVSCSLGLGADLFQGYYFSRPVAGADWRPKGVSEIIEKCAVKNKEAIVSEMMRRRAESAKHRDLLLGLAAKLSGHPPESFDRILNDSPLRSPELECLYVLDGAGIQVTRTVTVQTTRIRTRGPLFQPAAVGTDHSMKDYFYGLVEAGLPQFMTEPYVSLASGNLCRTLSCGLSGEGEGNYVLCLDLRAD